MAFWNTSEGDNTTEQGGEFEVGGGNMEPIPAGNKLVAMIEDAKWDEFGEDEFINLRWTVLDPAEYKNRKVFQKVKVYGTSRDKDPVKTADKAKRMLAAIDANCGGKLAKKDVAPSDADLQSALMNKPMVIEVQVWEFTGDDGQARSGNWVNAVAPKGSAQPNHDNGGGAAQKKDEKDGDIPF